MIDPSTGFAPPRWQSHVGPVVAWRPEGGVLADDMCLLYDFLLTFFFKSFVFAITIECPS